jgi:hypothetical protein
MDSEHWVHAIMAKPSWLNKIYFRYFSKPLNDRPVMLYIMENPVSSILEIGMGSGQRTKQLLKWCQLPKDAAQLRYVGVDLFESSPEDRPHLKLKQAHRMLSEAGAKAHLIPGDVTSALSRVANTVHPSQLVIIDGGYDSAEVSGKTIQQWLPRLATEHSAIFASIHPGGAFERIRVPQEVAMRRAA